MSGDVSMSCIFTSRSQPLSDNLIKDTGTVLVANGKIGGGSVHKSLNIFTIVETILS